MLKYLAPIVLVFFLLPTSQAAHINGIEISYKSLGSGQYYVQVALIRDCSGIQITGTSVPVTAVCGSNTSNFTLPHSPYVKGQGTFGTSHDPISHQAGSITMSGEEISDVCDSLLDPNINPVTRCRAGAAGGYARYWYSAIVTLPSCANLSLQTSVSARNLGNANITSGVVYAEAHVNTRDFPMNSAPEFGDRNRPIFEACIGKPAEYHFDSYDADGDSLTYRLTCPKINANTCASYSTGYSSTRPVNGAQLDTTTGRLLFNPSSAGKKVIAVIINEYERCTGIWKASTLRDVSMLVRACNNSLPKYTHGLSKVSGPKATKLDSFRLKVAGGTYFSIEDTIVDADTTDSLKLITNQQVFPGSNLAINYITGNKIHFKFSWTMPQSSYQNYVLHLVASDDRCDFPGKRRMAYHILSTSSFSLTRNSEFNNDTMYLFQGDTASISSSGVGKVNWSTPSGSSLVWSGMNQNAWGDTTTADTNASFRFLPTMSTVLMGTGTSVASCSSTQITTDTIYIKVVPIFQIKVPNDTVLCANVDSFQLDVTPDSNYRYTYHWTSDGAYISNDTLRNPWIKTGGSNLFSVEVRSEHGGVRRESVRVSLRSGLPAFEILAHEDSICPGGSVELEIKRANAFLGCRFLPKELAPKTARTYAGLQVFNDTSGFVRQPNPFTLEDNATRQQYLYHADSLLAQGMEKGIIQSISFYLDSTIGNSTYQIQNLNVGIACTPNSSISNWAVTTSVINSSSTYLQDGWNTLHLDTGYAWDGSSNLIIQICHNANLNASGIRTAMQDVSYDANIAFVSPVAACFTNNQSLSDKKKVPVMELGFVPAIDTGDLAVSWMPASSVNDPSKLKVLASPLTTTTYSAIISDSSQVCVDTLSHVVNVVANPLLFAGNDTSICFGDQVQFAPQLTPAQAGNFTWTPATGFVDPQVKDAVWTADTNRSLVVNFSNSKGCNAMDTIDVTVLPLPDPSILTTGPFCVTDGPISLMAVNSGGVFSGSAVNSQSGTFDPTHVSALPSLNAPRASQISYSLTSGLCSADTTISVVVYPQFDTVLTSPTVFCELDPAEKLTTRHSGGVWSGTGVSNGFFDPSIGVGDYNIRVDSTGFCGNSGTYTMKVLKAPDHDFPSIIYGCSNNPAILEAGNPGAMYEWSTGDTTQQITATTSGTYWLKISVGQSCELYDTTEVQVGDPCVGIFDPNSNERVRLFPNPSSGTVILQSSIAVHSLSLQNSIGQSVWSQAFGSWTGQSTLNFGVLPSGVYYLNVIDETGVRTLKIQLVNPE